MAVKPLDPVAILTVDAPRRHSRRVSRAELTIASWWRELLSPRDVATRGRYSVDKARRFITYANTTSRLRQAAVLLIYPLPGLIVALALALIPLKDPKLGVTANWAYFIHNFCMSWIVSASVMVQVRAVSLIDHREYGTLAIGTVAVVVATFCASFLAMVGAVWRFPTPFSWAITPLPFVTFMVLAHAVGFRGKRALSRHTRTRLLLYVPSLTLQTSQLAIYPAYSALFAIASEWQQVVLVVIFPGIKYVLKRSNFALSRHLGDFAREVAGTSVEISASMYQAAIMQSSPSLLVTATVIGLDVLLNIVDIKRYLDRRSIVPTEELLAKAFAIPTDESRPSINDQELAPFGTHSRSLLSSVLSVVKPIKHDRSVNCGLHAINLERSSAVAPSPPHTDGAISPAREDTIVVTHALEILQSAESILLAEYLEVAVPFVNTCYVLLASQLPSAVYNPKLAGFFFDPSQLRPATINVLLYTLLQGLTLAGMYVVMRVRCRLSALALLAFVMETHAWSLEGKLTVWTVIILVFPLVHYGVDFTFKFDFAIRTT